MTEHARDESKAQAERETLRAIARSEVGPLLKRAMWNYAGRQRLEPEHIVLQVLREHELPISPEAEDPLKRPPRERAESWRRGAQQGLSERTLTLMHDVVGAAGDEAPRLVHLLAVLSSSIEPYAIGLRDQLGRLRERLDATLFELLGVDLVRQAAEGAFDNVVERDREISQIETTLGKMRGNSVLIVGDAGVGKTALVHELARRIALDGGPFGSRGARLYWVSAADLRWRCSKEGPAIVLDRLVAEVRRAERAEPRSSVLLFIDYIEALFTGETAEDIAGSLHPLLKEGTLQIVGSALPPLLERRETELSVLLRELNVRKLEEPSAESARKMVVANLDKYGAHHRVEIDTDAARAAVDLARRYRLGILPRAALSLVDAAAVAVKRGSIPADAVNKARRVDAYAVELIVAEMLDIPVADVRNARPANEEGDDPRARKRR
jgi:ATP-dependent Clp protease ATP-binding subunit ClpA